MSDEKLKNIVETEPPEYTKEEIALVGQELVKRGYEIEDDAPATPILQSPNPSVGTMQNPMLRTALLFKNNILVFAFVALFIIVLLIFLLQPKNHEIPFAYKVDKLFENNAVSYIVHIETEPEIDVSYGNQRPQTDKNGQAIIRVASKNLPLSLASIPLTLISEEINITRNVQIDNRPSSFSFPNPVTDFQNTSDGKWLFNVEFSSPSDFSIFVNNYTLTTVSPGTVRLVYDASELEPFRPFTKRLDLLVRTSDNKIWQGYIDLTFQFPSTKITMNFRGNKVVKTSQSQVSFAGSTLTAYGIVSPRFLVEKLYLNDKEVLLKPDGSFEARLTGLDFGTNNIVARAEGKHHTSVSSTVYAYREATSSEKLAQYKRKSAGLSYAMLSKNPDRYKGQYVVYLGKIFTIQEDASGTAMQVNVTHRGYGFWDDQIMVSFTGQTDFVKENLVWVCGTVRGSYTYTSVAGWTITVPLIDAEYLSPYEGY